jgi:hypothetical protein
MPQNEHLPGERTPQSGHYEELNVLGALTGNRVYLEEGEPFPAAPRSFTWRPVRPEC